MLIEGKASRITKKGKKHSTPFVRAFFGFISSFIAAFTFIRLLKLLAAVIGIAFILFGKQTLDSLLQAPFDEVVIQGNLQHVKREQLQQVITHHANQGFIGLDMTALHSSLMSVPWVKSVAIQRAIPNQLVVSIIEANILARWNDEAYLTESLNIVDSSNHKVSKDIPMFIGEDVERVMHYFTLTRETISESMKPVRLIDVSDIGTVRIQLSQSVDILLNEKNFTEQLKRWVKVVETHAINHRDRLKRVDMRYASGMAVVFDQKATKNNNKMYVGGRD